MKPQPKIKPYRSPKYRAFVASHPCLVCGRGAVAHHEQEPHNGVMGGKAGDDRCVPLCPLHHAMRHQRGRSVWEEWGVDVEAAIEGMKREFGR